MNRGEISGARFQEIKRAVQKMSPSEVKAFLRLNPPDKVKSMLVQLDKETCADLLKRASGGNH
jgi:hypothetical protein